MERSPDDHLMSLKEVAEYLAIHEMTLYTLIHETDIPAMKLGGQWRFKKVLLDDWLSSEMNRNRLSGH
jgi:excisionase family DNA binding protein